MKLLLASLLLTSTVAAPAAASSFVMLKQAERQPSPSILLFVEPDDVKPAVAPELLGARGAEPQGAPPSRAAAPAADNFIPISRSVIAMGEPAVETTIVASIEPEEKRVRNPHLPPMVIRGGLSGDAFVRGNGQPAPGTASPLQASAPGRPAPAPGQQQPEPPRAPPPPSPQAPAAPTRLPQ